MPCLQEHLFVGLYQRGDSLEFTAPKSVIPLKPHGPKPELGLAIVARDMHVGWFDPVARMEKRR